MLWHEKHLQKGILPSFLVSEKRASRVILLTASHSAGGGQKAGSSQLDPGPLDDMDAADPFDGTNS